MKKYRNKGSAVIEMTLLIPILLACIYLYIMIFIHFVNYGKVMAEVSEVLYEEEWLKEEENKAVTVSKEGKRKVVFFEEQDKWFVLSVELKKNANEPVKQIRRWQFAAELF